MRDTIASVLYVVLLRAFHLRHSLILVTSERDILKGFAFALICMLPLHLARRKRQCCGKGLTKAEVVSAIGNPDGFHRSGDYGALHYVERQINGWLFTSGLNMERVDYSVIRKNDRVVQYGEGRIMDRSSGEPPFVLVRHR
jgi:hypothetical protein